MNKLYYTINTEDCDLKSIYVYEIQDNIPKYLIDLERGYEANSEAEISEWLISNGCYEDGEFTLTQL